MFQSLVTNIPGYVGEECLDVFRPLCRFVVEQESMLPHVHHQYWIESGYVACFMKRDPVIGESAVGRILVADGPTDAAQLADANKICLPDLVVAKTRLGGPTTRRGPLRLTRT